MALVNFFKFKYNFFFFLTRVAYKLVFKMVTATVFKPTVQCNVLPLWTVFYWFKVNFVHVGLHLVLKLKAEYLAQDYPLKAVKVLQRDVLVPHFTMQMKLHYTHQTGTTLHPDSANAVSRFGQQMSLFMTVCNASDLFHFQHNCFMLILTITNWTF